VIIATNWKLLAAVALGFSLLGLSNITRPREERVSLEWRPGIWLTPLARGAQRDQLPELLRRGQDTR
jgi:hypothetical protein